MHKTYENWDRNLIDYLQVGDTVDRELYSHFLNIMPPKRMYSNFIQMGGAYGESAEGKPTYFTIEKVDGEWTYRGTCHAGETEHQECLY